LYRVTHRGDTNHTHRSAPARCYRQCREIVQTNDLAAVDKRALSHD